MIKNGYVLDHSKSPCEKDFVPDVKVNICSQKCILNSIKIQKIKN